MFLVHEKQKPRASSSDQEERGHRPDRENYTHIRSVGKGIRKLCRTRRLRTTPTALTGHATARRVTIVGMLLLPTACSHGPLSPASGLLPLANMPSLTRAICIDPTASTASAFSHDVRTLLASAVAQWAHTAEPSTQHETPGQPGLDLTVRTVSTTAFSSDETNLHVVVPSVPTLRQGRPDVLAPDFQKLNGVWQEQFATVKRARTAAAATAADGAKAIAGLPLDPKTHSGITACAAALAVTTPAGTDRAFLVASDLEDTEPPELAGSFGGAPLTLLQPCPSGSAARCKVLADAFTARMARLHSGRVMLVRPELADSVIPAWLGGSR
jgi:hypothetical protein